MLGQLDLQAYSNDWWAARRTISPSYSPQQIAHSSSFVQYIVSFHHKANPGAISPCSPRQRSKSKTRRFKAIGSTIWGVMPFSRSSTQTAFFTSSARGENCAHVFSTSFHFQGPWTVRLVVDDAPFLVPSHTPHPWLQDILRILRLA